MGLNSRKDKRPNPEKWNKRWLVPMYEEVDTPQGKHKFAMLASLTMYWVSPSGAWRRIEA